MTLLLVASAARPGAAQRVPRDVVPLPPANAIEVTVRTLARIPRAAHDYELAQAVERFYADQRFSAAWVDERGFTPAAHSLRQAIGTAAEHGLDPRAYPLPRLDSLTSAARARADVSLSLTALRFAQDLGWGLVRPGDVHRDHAYPRRAFEGDSLLHAWLAAPDAGTALLAVAPPSPGYERLRSALQQLRGITSRDGWHAMSTGPALRAGSSGERVRELRTRLVERGDLASISVGSDVFDNMLGAAVARFQERHGLHGDSVFGAQSLAAMNVPLAKRLQQVALGMERIRWLPPVERGRWITVNLADQHVFALEDGRTVFRTRVVIGTRTNKTPMFIDTLTNIVLNPAWNVPPSIAVKEIWPEVRRDPSYLTRHHMVRVDGGIQQLPGPWNALGQIAFMFPNRFNVYMHDTPAKALFDAPDRTHSHGCIRVQRPHELAALLLEREGVSRAQIDSVIATGVRTVVWLRTPVPVRITYATAFVSDDGALQFRRDVYGRDALLQAVLDRERLRPGSQGAIDP
jgi:murein L,D-transpeptidase YcbB/YkuD